MSSYVHNDATASEALSSLITYAARRAASDLHIDPTDAGIAVRLRVDGQLQALTPLPRRLHEELIARLKVLAGLRTDEHFCAQDGRFYQDVEGMRLDIRLSIVPTYFGENAVLRLLPVASEATELSKLGLTDDQERMLREAISRSQGMVLVTGPTGSGKTTTLYGCMRLLAENPLSLVSIEDPVEYSLPGVVQIPVRPRTGFTFANGLRSILRQDPDVLMVGEIRDSDTARIATHAALTGHLVLATLHTKDAPGALLRLLDLGVEPYLIASTISLVVSQRLVRRNCLRCRERVPVSDAQQKRLAVLQAQDALAHYRRGSGCSACAQSGYSGRVGIYEFLAVDSRLQAAVAERTTHAELHALASAQGMQPLFDVGLARVIDGCTSLDELLRLDYVRLEN